MARVPLLQLSDISLTFGGTPVFSGITGLVQPGDRVALVGRNGSGKSTLMKIMAGLVEQDHGNRVVPPGKSVGYMEQDPDMAGFATLGDFAVSAMDPSEAYRVEMVADGLKFDPAAAVSTSSGGERRRAALAKLMAEAPDLMLLDEPTNHMDIEAIQWLESELSTTRNAYVLISHDRAFLKALTRATLWIDRGVLRRQEKGFAAFEDWRDETWTLEDQDRHKLDRKIKAEAKWAVEGISARRTRDMGRMRALREMQKGRSEMIARPNAAAMKFEAGDKSGKKVVEVKGLTKAFGDKTLLRPFDFTVMRGDRIAIVGPNGVGKTTFVNMLLGTMEPDEGTVKQGTNLNISVFDQTRAQLHPERTLMETLSSDPSMAVSGKSDQIMVRGQPKHVVGYLKEFLFTDVQARAVVRSLSGGEKARLWLARMMALESNVLVLDEPTNDLDIETLDLLQEILDDYDGTVLLISHDRDFIDRVATTTITLEPGGQATVFAGGWTDMLSQGGLQKHGQSKGKPASKSKQAAKSEEKPSAGLSFTEKHRLEALPAELDRFAAEIAKLEDFLGQPNLFTDHPVKFNKATEALVERHAALADAEEEWLELEEKAGG